MPRVAVTARVKAKEGRAEELIAESELIVGEPLAGKGLPG
jgi:hypothetical protein